MLLLKLCALCLATEAAAGSVASLASFVSHGVNESLRIWVEIVPSQPLKVFGSARSQKWIDLLYHCHGTAGHFTLLRPERYAFKEFYDCRTLPISSRWFDEI